jgi:hypothetical protein
MVIIGTIGQKGGSDMIVEVCPLMSRSEAGHQYMIGWGAGSMCMNDWVDALSIFQGIKKIWKKWQMLDFLMRIYSTEIPIYVVWTHLRFIISRF